jgi:hypothetical protein
LAKRQYWRNRAPTAIAGKLLIMKILIRLFFVITVAVITASVLRSII